MRNLLRSRLIRLANAQPELRPHLLPLLKTAMVPDGYTEVVVDVPLKVEIQMPIKVMVSPEGNAVGFTSPTMEEIRNQILQNRHAIGGYQDPSLREVAYQYKYSKK